MGVFHYHCILSHLSIDQVSRFTENQGGNIPPKMLRNAERRKTNVGCNDVILTTQNNDYSKNSTFWNDDKATILKNLSIKAFQKVLKKGALIECGQTAKDTKGRTRTIVILLVKMTKTDI